MPHCFQILCPSCFGTPAESVALILTKAWFFVSRLTTELHETEEEAQTILRWLTTILVIACVR